MYARRAIPAHASSTSEIRTRQRARRRPAARPAAARRRGRLRRCSGPCVVASRDRGRGRHAPAGPRRARPAGHGGACCPWLSGTRSSSRASRHRPAHAGSPTIAASTRILAANWSEPAARDRRLALVMLDLDNFKAVNDAHGHPYGDEVLRSIGKALRIAVERTRDTAARVGGEEFALIVPDRDAEAAYRDRGARAGRRARRSRFAASTSPARRGSRRIRTTPRTRRASASSPRAPSIGRSAGARAALAASTPGTCRSPGPGAAPAEVAELLAAPSSRSRRSSSRWWPSPAGTWSATRRWRGSRPRRSARPRRGSRRRTAAAWDPTWRRRRSGPRSSRWADRSGPTSRSTSARRPSPRRRSSERCPRI